MRVYLDNCVMNRPFDDQSHIRIRLEAEAKLYIQARIKEGSVELAWSYILDIENDQNPFEDKKNAIAEWKKFAIVDVDETTALLERANVFTSFGIKAKDALHVSAAIEGKTDVFITTDDRLVKKLLGIKDILAVNPVDIVGEIDECND